MMSNSYLSAAESMREHQRRLKLHHLFLNDHFFKPLYAAFIGAFMESNQFKFNDTTAVPGYEKLEHELLAAYMQSSSGKGHERHNMGGDIPFHKQRMQTISELIGSVKGMEYQAIKKITEGLGLSTHEAQVKELHGAIVYIAGMITFLKEVQRKKYDALHTGGLANTSNQQIVNLVQTGETVVSRAENTDDMPAFGDKLAQAEEDHRNRANFYRELNAFKEKFGIAVARKFLIPLGAKKTFEVDPIYFAPAALFLETIVVGRKTPARPDDGPYWHLSAAVSYDRHVQEFAAAFGERARRKLLSVFAASGTPELSKEAERNVSEFIRAAIEAQDIRVR